MKWFQKLFAFVLCMAVLGCAAMPVYAEDDLGMIESVEGVRWFPVPENRQNDDAWEAECIADGCLCQRFTETAEDTGNSNFLDTEYTAEGGLKLTRNNSTVILGGTDYTERYWPRIRTISLETSPALDLKTANTLYFDIEVAEGTEWNVSLSVNGMNIGVAKFMAAAGGADLDPMVKEITDAPAGHFKGSINVLDVIDQLAADANQYDSVNAQALKNMKKTFVPQVQVYCVGGIGASLTIHELFMSTPEDTTGEKCSFVDMGLLTGLGDEYYADESGDPDDTTTTGDEPSEDGTEEPTTTKATTTTQKSDAKADSAMPIWIIVAAVAVVVVAAVVIVVFKKKK